MAGPKRRKKAREHSVFTLNLRADKIFRTTVDKVHYDTNLGLAEITPKSMIRFCARFFPEQQAEMAQYVADHPDTLYLDFEQTLTGMEGLQGYEALLRAARCQGVESAAHKGFLACALVMHAMRSHELMSAMLKVPRALDMEKWEYFWLLRNAWTSRVALSRAVTPLALGTWTFWRTAVHTFPLPDSPVMFDQDSVLAIISPRLLLSIDLTMTQPEDQWNIVENISTVEFDAFRRRAIANAFNDILFPDAPTLQQWQSRTEYQDRIGRLATPDERDLCLREAAARIVWAISGFGRVPGDFESWAERIFDREIVVERTEDIRRTW